MSPQPETPATAVTNEPVEPESITQTNEDTNEPEEQEPVTQEEEVTLGTTTPTSQEHGPQPSEDAAKSITPKSGPNIRAEPSILDILEAK